jgi:toxin CcdB
MARVVEPRQFDVFENPSARGRRERPFLVVVQSDVLSDRRTRVVAPLVALSELQPLARLNPVVEVEGRKFYFHPAELAHISQDMLRDAIANLESERYRLIAALDLVFTGI